MEEITGKKQADRREINPQMTMVQITKQGVLHT